MADFYLFVTHNGARRVTDRSETEGEVGTLVTVHNNKALYTRDEVQHTIELSNHLNSDEDIANAVTAHSAAEEEKSRPEVSIPHHEDIVAYEHTTEPVRIHRGHGPELQRIPQHISDYVGEQLRSAGREYDRSYARDVRVNDIEAQLAMLREETRSSIAKLTSDLNALAVVVSDAVDRVSKVEQSQQKIIERADSLLTNLSAAFDRLGRIESTLQQ